MYRGLVAFLVAGAALALAWPASSAPAADADAPVFAPAVRLPGTDGFNEPRIDVDPQGRQWAIANNHQYHSLVFRSDDGGRSFAKVTDPAQASASPDVDIVRTRTGRLIASELDGGAVGLGTTTFITSYSDDEGKTWKESTGMVPVDTDRQWLAVGPDDSATHQPRVYLLFHNLLSGAVAHGMFVQTSTDNGASFGSPVLITPTGSQALLDLQCADSGGPSSLSVNPTTGRLYAVFNTRSSALGGCGASVTDEAEINIIRATRVWVATSPDGSDGSWQMSLAVDDSPAKKIVGLQLSYGALDRAGNFYVAYPETVSYDDMTAAVKLVHAPADLSTWSSPVTIAPVGAGHALVHLIAGDPGRVAVAYFEAHPDPAGNKFWYSMAAVSTNALDTTPTFHATNLSNAPAFKGTIDEMEGRCSTRLPPLAGVIDGFACFRFSDVYGIAQDAAGHVVVTWPGEADTERVLAGAYVSTQTGGPLLRAPTPSSTPATKPSVVAPRSVIAVTGRREHLLALLALVGLALALARLRLSGRSPAGVFTDLPQRGREQ